MVTLIYLLIQLLKELLQWLLFVIEKGLCWVVGFLNDLFEIAAGVKTVAYDAEDMPLINVFFKNSTVKTIYWGMALLGIVLCFGFTIAAVIRKAGDTEDKVKQSMGGILTNALKSILLILLMNAIITASVTVTNVLMDRVNFLFLNAQNFSFDYYVYFDEDDYAAMARSLNTIGNYSLNASYNSRYNLNSCYNAIRPDLQQLADDGKFDVTYIVTEYDENGNETEANTWQSVLQSIYRAMDDITVDQPLDEYNASLSAALLKAMDIIHNDPSLYAMDKYHVQVAAQGQGFGEAAPLDRLIMLIGSMYGSGSGLAKGSGLTDYIRSPYYYGQKDIFDYDTVESDFDLSLGAWNHLTVIVVAFLALKEMLGMTFNAIARIFNMLLLYLAAPPFIAATPLDEGQKAKQWASAFMVQSLGLFGTLMAMRLLLIFIPILFDTGFVLFGGSRLDFYARVIILIAILFTVRKASGMITGILSNNGAGASGSAGDISGEAIGAFDRGTGLAWGAAKMAGGLALSAGSWAIGKDIDAAKAIFGGGGKKKESSSAKSSNHSSLRQSGNGKSAAKQKEPRTVFPAGTKQSYKKTMKETGLGDDKGHGIQKPAENFRDSFSANNSDNQKFHNKFGFNAPDSSGGGSRTSKSKGSASGSGQKQQGGSGTENHGNIGGGDQVGNQPGHEQQNGDPLPENLGNIGGGEQNVSVPENQANIGGGEQNISVPENQANIGGGEQNISVPENHSSMAGGGQEGSQPSAVQQGGNTGSVSSGSTNTAPHTSNVAPGRSMSVGSVPRSNYSQPRQTPPQNHQQKVVEPAVSRPTNAPQGQQQTQQQQTSAPQSQPQQTQTSAPQSQTQQIRTMTPLAETQRAQTQTVEPQTGRANRFSRNESGQKREIPTAVKRTKK